MALLSDLVKVVAAIEGLDEVSVGIFARAAREAGLITQKGRGRGAAHMSNTDAANLLIAVNGCILAKEVSQRVPQFRKLKMSSQYSDLWLRSDIEKLVNRNEKFGDQLEYLIELAKPIKGSTSELSRLIGGMYDKKDLKYARDRKIAFQWPELRVVFELPIPEASIRIWAPGTAVRERWNPRIPYREMAASEFTLDEHIDEGSKDRTVEVTISHHSLIAVSECLYQ